MPRKPTSDDARIEDCRRLFLKYGGKQHERIEAEMRELGHHDFNRRSLYPRRERGRVRPGWIERFEWRKSLQSLASPESPESLEGPGGCARSNDSRDSPDFPAWLRRVSPNLRWDWRYQQEIYRALERVTSGESKRLMIFLPPRHGKSELVTVRYVAHRLKQDPSLNVILAGHTQRLANRFSRKIKNVLCDDAALSAIENGEWRIENGELMEVRKEKRSTNMVSTARHNSSRTDRRGPAKMRILRFPFSILD